MPKKSKTEELKRTSQALTEPGGPPPRATRTLTAKGGYAGPQVGTLRRGRGAELTEISGTMQGQPFGGLKGVVRGARQAAAELKNVKGPRIRKVARTRPLYPPSPLEQVRQVGRKVRRGVAGLAPTARRAGRTAAAVAPYTIPGVRALAPAPRARKATAGYVGHPAMMAPAPGRATPGAQGMKSSAEALGAVKAPPASQRIKKRTK